MNSVLLGTLTLMQDEAGVLVKVATFTTLANMVDLQTWRPKPTFVDYEGSEEGVARGTAFAGAC
jgi:hypothetical protein